ncbi:threonine dehydratase [Salirhabdus euzebyi]|uniref:threonine ammonia-lyase n=1 Tax=Salirhabdus euzebyi TaxID=394506 RepID=A0A841Q323_9BACI|nr:threonine/serine dehydratase [Salirhabdus euzebyi]MBB6452308.1 threonine dehydratase [Salirhabdus euzebyi]
MVTLNRIHDARNNIMDTVIKTPMYTSEQLNKISKNNIFLKGEHVQKTGSFKIRGATNKVKQAVEEGAKYITAASSGNHGQAVAYIANKLGVPSKIVVPEDAVLSKLNAIESYGGLIEKCGTTSAERLPRAKEIAKKENGIFIPPYDDPFIMAGQGTVGLEIIDQIESADIIIVPIGGGGLLSGILTAIKETKPSIKVIGVEPEVANDTFLSLQAGKITSIHDAPTIADGLRTSQPGDLTFPVLLKYLDDLILVSEEEIKHAFQFVLERMKQLIEPSSATTIAAAMFHKLGVENKNIVAVISGGNVDIKQINHFF